MLARGLSNGFMEKQLGITIRLHRLKIQRSAEQLCGKPTENKNTSSPTRRRRIPRSVTSAPSKMRPQSDRQRATTGINTNHHHHHHHNNNNTLEPRPRKHNPLPSPQPRPRNAPQRQRPKKKRPSSLLNDSALNALGKDNTHTHTTTTNKGRRTSVSSPVSSLRAKNLSGRRSGRVLGRRTSSPRSSRSSSPANSVRSTTSSAFGDNNDNRGSPHGSSHLSHASRFQAGSSTTTDTSSGEDHSQSPRPRQQEEQQQQQQQRRTGRTGRVGGENKQQRTTQEEPTNTTTRQEEKDDDEGAWRPFSAPIGYATKKYKHERRNSTDSLTSINSITSFNSNLSRHEKPLSSGRSSNASNKYHSSVNDTPWTWDQLLASSDMSISVWLKKVAQSTSFSGSSSGTSSSGTSSSSASSSASSWQDELTRVTRSMSDEGYVTVRDLLSDVNEVDFRSDLRSWGMRKRFLNEVIHRLKDMEEAFDVLAARSERNEARDQEAGGNIRNDGIELYYLWQQQQKQELSHEPPPPPPSYTPPPKPRQPKPFHMVGLGKKRGLQKPANLSIVTPAGGSRTNNDNTSALSIPYHSASPQTINQVAATEKERMNQNRPAALQLGGSAEREEQNGNGWGGLANSQSFVITPQGSIVTGPFRIGPSGTVPIEFSVGHEEEGMDSNNGGGTDMDHGRRRMNRTREESKSSTQGGGGNGSKSDRSNAKDLSPQHNSQNSIDAGNQSMHKKRSRSTTTTKRIRARANSVISSPSGGSIEDDLVILRRLGAGAGGVVHKALHVPSLTVVAVKKIRVFSKSEMKQMKKELLALYKCSAVPSTAGNNYRSNTTTLDATHKKEHPGITRARGGGGGGSGGSGGSGDTGNGSAIALGSKSSSSSPSQRGGSLSPLGQGECPHVVSFYDAFYTSSGDHTISLVLEYMDAGSLQDLINTSKNIMSSSLLLLLQSTRCSIFVFFNLCLLLFFRFLLFVVLNFK